MMLDDGSSSSSSPIVCSLICATATSLNVSHVFLGQCLLALVQRQTDGEKKIGLCGQRLLAVPRWPVPFAGTS